MDGLLLVVMLFVGGSALPRTSSSNSQLLAPVQSYLVLPPYIRWFRSGAVADANLALGDQPLLRLSPEERVGGGESMGDNSDEIVRGDEFGIFANSFKNVSIRLPLKVTYKDSVGATSNDFAVRVVV